MLQRLKDTGGCECWDWKPEHIETKLVKKGFMEPTPDEKAGCRKRKKISRRRNNTQVHYQHALPGGIGDWSTGLGLQPSFHRPMHQPYGMMSNDNHIQTQPPDLTVEQNEELIDQLFNKTQFKADPDESVSPEAMDITYDNSNAGADRATSSAPTARSMATTQSPTPAQASQAEQTTRLARQVINQFLDDDQYRRHRS